jgi:hypothetical protein
MSGVVDFAFRCYPQGEVSLLAEGRMVVRESRGEGDCWMTLEVAFASG